MDAALAKAVAEKRKATGLCSVVAQSTAAGLCFDVFKTLQCLVRLKVKW